jgi:hypothetical protein
VEATPIEDSRNSFPGSLVGQRICMIAYVDDDGGLLAVEYPAEPLNAELGAAIMGNLIKDILGEEPDLRDVVSMQRTLVACLQGGDSDGKRTAG